MRTLAMLFVIAACGGTEPAFPADYTTSYVEVRNCRASADHDLHHIRILADPAALAPYRDRTAFPDGAVVLKEEYDFADDACSGPLLEWTVMTKTADAAHLGWSWQRVAASREVVSEDDGRCINCHTTCGIAPDGFDGTCAVP